MSNPGADTTVDASRSENVARPTLPEAPQGRRAWLSDAVMLALAPIVAITLTFCYEAGFLAWYGVPYWYARLDAVHVLTTAAGLLVLIAAPLAVMRWLPILPWFTIARLAWTPFCFLFFAWLPFATPPAATASRLALRMAESVVWCSLGPSTSICARTLAGAAESPGVHDLTVFFAVVRVLWILGFGAIGLAIFYSYLIKPIAKYKHEPTWEARWTLRLSELPSLRPTNYAEHLIWRGFDYLGLRTGAVVAALIVLGDILYYWGAVRADVSTTQVLLDSHRPCVVVRRYGDAFLCVDVDTANRAIQRGFRLIPYADSSSRFVMVQLGRLRPSGASIAAADSLRPLR